VADDVSVPGGLTTRLNFGLTETRFSNSHTLYIKAGRPIAAPGPVAEWRRRSHARSSKPGSIPGRASNFRISLKLFSGRARQCALPECDLPPNDVDVTAQVIHLIGEGQREADMADGILDAVDLGLLLGQVFVVWSLVE